MSRDSRPLPILLPNIAGRGRGVSREPPPPPTNKHPQKERKRIAVACEACRMRKTKCDGRQPKCNKCDERRSTCIYAEVIPMKRKYEELERQRSAHEELFEMLRSMSEQESYSVLQRIRAGANPESILNQIRDGNLLMQLALVPEHRSRYEFPYMRAMPEFLLQSENIYTDTLVYEFSFAKANYPGGQELQSGVQNSHASLYMTPYHSAKLVDPNLDHARPSEWTSVCSNNHLMRRLIGDLFLSEYHMGSFFHKDYFLQDMAAGRHQCCSSLLVNAVLAWACFCDQENPCRAEFWNPDNLGYRFLAEARRLWELEVIQPQLTTIHAALILNVVYNMNGADKLGYRYNAQAVAMANELEIFSPSTGISKREQDARDFTAWFLYAYQGPNSYMMHKPPLCPVPPKAPLPDPSERPDWYSEIRFKFPSSSAVFSSHFGYFLRARIQLWAIAIDMASEFFTDENNHYRPSSPQVLAYCARLLEWYTDLPEPMQPRRIVTPYQLQLHMQYHNFIINLLEEPMATTLSLPEHMTETLHILKQQPKDMLLESKRSMEILVRLYYLRHGFKANNAMMVQYLSLLAFSTFAAIQADTHPTYLQSLRSTIILAAMGLRDQSHSHYLGQLVFNAVRGNMGAEEIELIDRFIGQGRGVAKLPPKDWRMQTIWAVDSGSITAEKRLLSDLIKPDGDEGPNSRVQHD
ncbi:hypothetical protein BU24DRAFT_429269 [Aaosphaeria arxii CBS 175.79]|uniref:Zn(2)-C6 fungal-type domain-containing protein n=1 Tax=Aaosphaeria arxii CBS 175.79 TaxID=1450172 RepID=A0A6A5X798_9PLEO|nr:uncharacterized protein BU24DRAFT_429269 [Aaosphaeria arxii CBS 175.79]KAF2008697.1 hypothetical protein BU24DRAFT_429269 [Aaosphaeria arxii CBS 175.79]